MADIGVHDLAESAAPADRPAALGLALLRCPRCGGSLAAAPGVVACVSCAMPVPMCDGIIDFVAGASATALDAIDYDEFYAINLESSLHQFNAIRALAGPLWPNNLGDVVEIGCGTGGFSMGYLTECEAGQVVLTDISVKMLGICRMRLARMGKVRAAGLTFATYSGTETCFAAKAFDTCLGASVVHHIIDVPSLLRQMHRLLKPGGRAFFWEPNLRFHRAVTATLGDILGTWIANRTVSDADISLMMNWMAEVHCNVVNSGEIEVLAGREDKHQFEAEQFEAMAEAAGFGSAKALPGGPDPTGSHTIRSYLVQSGISAPTLDRLSEVWPAAQARHFAALVPRDQSPSYLFWLGTNTRKGTVRRIAPDPAGVDPDPVSAGGSPPLHLWLHLTIKRQGDAFALVTEGWCVAVERLKSVEITVAGKCTRLPIWWPRRDVHVAVNSDGRYPALHSLCSGISGTVPFAGVIGDESRIAVRVDVVTVDGDVLPGATATLVPDGDSATIDHYITTSE